MLRPEFPHELRFTSLLWRLSLEDMSQICTSPVSPVWPCKLWHLQCLWTRRGRGSQNSDNSNFWGLAAPCMEWVLKSCGIPSKVYITGLNQIFDVSRSWQFRSLQKFQFAGDPRSSLRLDSMIPASVDDASSLCCQGWNWPAVAALALLPKPLWSEAAWKRCQTEEFQEFFKDCGCCHISSLATCRVLDTTLMHCENLWNTLRNKPYLPIPSGRLSLTSAWIVVLSSLFLAEAMTLCFQNLDGSISYMCAGCARKCSFYFFSVFSRFSRRSWLCS